MGFPGTEQRGFKSYILLNELNFQTFQLVKGYFCIGFD